MSHALLSPSGASKWMKCPGALRMEKGLTDGGSSNAREGTAAHYLAATCLTSGKQAADFIGSYILVVKDLLTGGDDCAISPTQVQYDDPLDCFTVDAEFAGYVQDYLDLVRSQVGDGTLMVEQSLSIEHLTGEPHAKGTADAVILKGDEIIVIDLKFGRGVRVDAKDNAQLDIYTLAALEEFGILQEFKTATRIIAQPRLNHYPEITGSVADLLRFEARVKERAHHASSVYYDEKDDAIIHHLVPGEGQCRWCKAKASCPALLKAVADAVDLDFEDLDAKPDTPEVSLGAKLSAVPLVEMWCKAVRSEAEALLLNGGAVEGFKLVQGKRGNRAWSDKAVAEETMKSMRIKHDQMYDYAVISPTTAEKLFKAEVIGKRQWPRLQELITQSDGKPSVAPASDPRDALVLEKPEDGFEIIEEVVDDLFSLC